MLSLEISCSKGFSQLIEKSALPVIAFRVGWFNPFACDGCITTHRVKSHDSKLICMISEHTGTNWSDLHDLQGLQHDVFFSTCANIKKNTKTTNLSSNSLWKHGIS